MDKKKMLNELWRFYQKQKLDSGMTLDILSKRIGISAPALHYAIHPQKRFAGKKVLKKIEEFLSSENSTPN